MDLNATRAKAALGAIRRRFLAVQAMVGDGQSVRGACKAAGVSHSWYYKWKPRFESEQGKENERR